MERRKFTREFKLEAVRLIKDRRERSASAVRERIRPALAIVRDESPDCHGLHRTCEDADPGMIDAGRGTE